MTNHCKLHRCVFIDAIKAKSVPIICCGTINSPLLAQKRNVLYTTGIEDVGQQYLLLHKHTPWNMERYEACLH